MSQLLNGRKDRGLVARKRLAERQRPRELVGHLRDNGGKECQCHETRLEPGLHRRVLERRSFEPLVVLEPLIELGDLGRVLGAHEHLGQQAVRVQGHGSEDLFERRRGQLSRRLKVRAWRTAWGCGPASLAERQAGDDREHPHGAASWIRYRHLVTRRKDRPNPTAMEDRHSLAAGGAHGGTAWGEATSGRGCLGGTASL